MRSYYGGGDWDSGHVHIVHGGGGDRTEVGVDEGGEARAQLHDRNAAHQGDEAHRGGRTNLNMPNCGMVSHHHMSAFLMEN